MGVTGYREQGTEKRSAFSVQRSVFRKQLGIDQP